MTLADRANQYIDEKKPWALVKEAGRETEVHAVCSVGINLFRQLMTYLAPILPQTASASRSFLNVGSLDWAAREQLLLGHTINAFKPLMTRVEKEKVDAMVDASKESLVPAAAAPAPAAADAPAPEIGIEDFMKVDLRVARIPPDVDPL